MRLQITEKVIDNVIELLVIRLLYKTEHIHHSKLTGYTVICIISATLAQYIQ